MKGLVLCAVFLVLGGEQSFGVNVNLDFLNDPDFPGNVGFTAKMDQYVQDTVNSATNSANSANIGNSGSNVVNTPVVTTSPDGTTTYTASTVTESRPRRPTRRPRPPRPTREPRPPRPMRPQAVRPRPTLKPTPSITTIVPDYENNIIAPTVTGSMPLRPRPVRPQVVRPRPPLKPTISKPNMPNIRNPHFPPNFPFPPDCSEVADPGYKFRDPAEFGNSNFGNEIKYRSFLCTDPEYGQDSFYMQITESHPPNNNIGVSRAAAYYDKSGKSINYSPKVVMLPQGESLPVMPKNDYLRRDVTF